MCKMLTQCADKIKGTFSFFDRMIINGYLPKLVAKVFDHVTEYNAFNRTHRAETFDGNIQINRYDTEGLRHEMEENGKLVQFIFRGTEVVAEESQGSRIRYIRTGELLASDAECARTYYHYASDEMGSITHVTAGVAKEGGEEEEPPGVKILNQYEYDAWGNVTACEETVENRFRFNGQQYDPVAQQYYLRARFYNPVIGRFTQEDTYRGDGLNLYTYCRNNPVYYVDPSGHFCQNAADRINDLIDEGRIKGKNREKLMNYLQGQIDAGNITPWERDVADKLGVRGSSTAGSDLGTTSNEIVWNNGWRTSDGKFASPQGDQLAGAWAERDVWNAIGQKDGWKVIEGRVYVTDNTGQIRVYDGVAITPNNKAIGLEVKSGNARLTSAQRSFDRRISVSNPAHGIGQHSDIEITHAITIRR